MASDKYKGIKKRSYNIAKPGTILQTMLQVKTDLAWSKGFNQLQVAPKQICH